MWTLITGANGFVGRHVTQYLFKNGHYIIALKRGIEPIPEMPSEYTGQYCPIIGDLSKSIKIGMPVDTIIHLAAQIIEPGTSSDLYAKRNIDTVAGAIKLAQDLKVKNFIFLSSVSVYGQVSTDIIDEDSPSISPAPYGASKYLGEKMLAGLPKAASVTCIRTPGIVGSGANPNWINDLIKNASNGDDLTISNPESYFNSVVHVKDVCKFIELILGREHKTAFDIVNMASTSPLRIRELAEIANKYYDNKSAIIVRKDGTKPFLISTEKLKTTYGFDAMRVHDALELSLKSYKTKT